MYEREISNTVFALYCLVYLSIKILQSIKSGTRPVNGFVITQENFSAKVSSKSMCVCFVTLATHLSLTEPSFCKTTWASEWAPVVF